MVKIEREEERQRIRTIRRRGLRVQVCSACVQCTLVIVNCHGAISQVVVRPRGKRTVDRDLVVVGSQSMAMGVHIGEETSLRQRMEGENIIYLYIHVDVCQVEMLQLLTTHKHTTLSTVEPLIQDTLK